MLYLYLSRFRGKGFLPLLLQMHKLFRQKFDLMIWTIFWKQYSEKLTEKTAI